MCFMRINRSGRWIFLTYNSRISVIKPKSIAVVSHNLIQVSGEERALCSAQSFRDPGSCHQWFCLPWVYSPPLNPGHPSNRCEIGVETMSREVLEVRLTLHRIHQFYLHSLDQKVTELHLDSRGWKCSLQWPMKKKKWVSCVSSKCLPQCPNSFNAQDHLINQMLLLFLFHLRKLRLRD
jgi:hypothetical protein